MQHRDIRLGEHYSYGLPRAFGPRLRVVVVDLGPFARSVTDRPPTPIDGEQATGIIRSSKGVYLAVRAVDKDQGPNYGRPPVMIVKPSDLVRPWTDEVTYQREFDAARATATEAAQVQGARLQALKTRMRALGIDAEITQHLEGTRVTLPFAAVEDLVARTERIR